MNQDFRWFKFDAGLFLSGEISFEEDDIQGQFVQICCYYWLNECSLTIAKLRSKYGQAIDQLLKAGIIKEKDGLARIMFLDNQWSERVSDHENNTKNGSRGAQVRWHGYSIKEEEEDKDNKYSQIFDQFRIDYPGTKRGLKTEFDNFVKKTKDWREVISNLHAALDAQKLSRELSKKRGDFVPSWKNLKTWINNRCWEDSVEQTVDVSGTIPPRPSPDAEWNYEKGRWEVDPNKFFKTNSK